MRCFLKVQEDLEKTLAKVSLNKKTGNLSHCSLSGTVTHTSANSIMKVDRK